MPDVNDLVSQLDALSETLRSEWAEAHEVDKQELEQLIESVSCCAAQLKGLEIRLNTGAIKVRSEEMAENRNG